MYGNKQLYYNALRHNTENDDTINSYLIVFIVLDVERFTFFMSEYMATGLKVIFLTRLVKIETFGMFVTILKSIIFPEDDY